MFELRAPDRLTAQCCQVSGLYEGFVLFLSSILICGCEVLFALFFVALFFARSVVDRHSLCVVLDRLLKSKDHNFFYLIAAVAE